MMTEFEALEIVSAHDGETPQAVRAAFCNAGSTDDLKYRSRMEQLLEDELIEGSHCMVVITARGLDLLAKYRKEVHQEKEERRQKLWESVASVLSMLPLTETAAFRTVVNFARLFTPSSLAALWHRVKNWVK